MLKKNMPEIRGETLGGVVFALAMSMIAVPVLASDRNESGGESGPGYCSRTAELVLKACHAEINDDYWIARGNCLNISDAGDRKACVVEASVARNEGQELCEEQYDARLELCDSLGEDRYEPDFSPSRFVNPLEIGKSVSPNPFFPLVAGYQWIYEKTFLDEDGEVVTETIRVVVTDKTKLIEGVTCLVVKDVAEEDGEVIEATDDWYAQDLDGNVWYCGEIAQNFETFPDDDPAEPELVNIEGSWKAGRDYAKPGILMFANPQVGTVYRQEMLLGDAEDAAEIMNLAGSASAPAAACTGDCLVTQEYSPIDPGVYEDKYYAPGVGQILAVDMEGNREELVEFIGE